MAKANLGTKRVCPETNRKFYDLDKDPIVSPYTGKEYPISFFEGETNVVAPKPEDTPPPAKEVNTDEEETSVELEMGDDEVDIISLDDAEDDVIDPEDDADGEIPDIPDLDVDDDDDADDDAFLETDDSDDDLSDVIVRGESGDDET